MSAYSHVRDGATYPAVLLAHGVNDPRVPVWGSKKMGARLQTATRSDNLSCFASTFGPRRDFG